MCDLNIKSLWIDLHIFGDYLMRQPLFHYAGGFNPVLVELADALPVQAFTRNYID